MILEAVELTRQLVQMESTNPGREEYGISEFIAGQLDKRGVLVLCEKTKKGRPNLIAQIEGEEKESALVFICHMDTVVAGSGWTRDPFSAQIEDGKLYGRGSGDMKGGLACALSAFGKIQDEVRTGKIKLRRSLKLICTADEEGDMTGVEQVIASGHVTKNDWVMDLEPTDGQIQMAHKGRLWILLTVKGITAHASRPELGADAVAAAAEVICRLRRFFGRSPKHPALGQSTITFGQIEGGYQPYVVPDLARIWMDMRLVPPFTSDKVIKDFEDILKEVGQEIPGVTFTYEITGNRPYIEENKASGLLLALQEVCEEVTGQRPPVRPFPGYTDTAVVAGTIQNRDCLSYGPGSLSLAHKPDEWVSVDDLLRCEKICIKLAKRVCL